MFELISTMINAAFPVALVLLICSSLWLYVTQFLFRPETKRRTDRSASPATILFVVSLIFVLPCLLVVALSSIWE
ncbi:hypothetical protein HS041_14730 [Planomonospora sp. ID67723]|uniref:hypothetical protein n=1 Tax=Planomonospora sp. ID67723 TaxID=2738134 RepID=UPI0018C36062|nr:hypothetical protein [Planomonospora sp. ID67723]MBG0829026.1 hypothetical protein [Planomonospora sp. ID67723]